MNLASSQLAADGIPMKEVVRRTGHRRGTMRQIIRGHRSDMFGVSQSTLETYLPVLDELWKSGQQNGAELWRQLKRKGFRGCSRVVGAWRQGVDEPKTSVISNFRRCHLPERLLG